MRRFRIGVDDILAIIGILLLAGAVIFGVVKGYKAVNGNKDLLQTDYDFKKVVIKLPNDEVVTGEVAEWTTYDNKDTVKVKLKNGKQYLGHSSDIVLYND
jgi:small nuclear ribonucleoprotein (snRNP)-like protein